MAERLPVRQTVREAKGAYRSLEKEKRPRAAGNGFAGTRLAFSSNGARLAPPLNNQKPSKTKRRPSEWTASEATEFEQLPAQR